MQGGDEGSGHFNSQALGCFQDMGTLRRGDEWQMETMGGKEECGCPRASVMVMVIGGGMLGSDYSYVGSFCLLHNLGASKGEVEGNCVDVVGLGDDVKASRGLACLSLWLPQSQGTPPDLPAPSSFSPSSLFWQAGADARAERRGLGHWLLPQH